MDIQNDSVHKSDDFTSGSVSIQDSSRFRRPFLHPLRRPKQCVFCVDLSKTIDFKNLSYLYRFISDRSKILSRRVTGLCSYHQRRVAANIKIARFLALIK